MSGTKWTNEQWDAITEKNCSLLVAAAAGAGKTAVLVERIIRKITDESSPIDIDRLLVVTFTNAAATEMRERIADAISGVLEKNPDSGVIQRQLALLGKASITTIHSFCLEVIRSNFQHIDIDPDFRIADETESTLMKLEALSELFEEQYEKEDNQEFFELLECYGGNRDDQILMDMVLNLYTFIQSSPWPQEWLHEMTESFHISEGTDFSSTPWGKILIDSMAIELEGLRDMLTRAIDMIRSGTGLEKYLGVFHEDLDHINRLIDLTECGEPSSSRPVWDDLYGCISGVEFSTLPRAGKEADKEKQEQVKKIRDDVKAAVRKMRERLITEDSASIINDLNNLYPKMKCLAGLTIGLAEKYNSRKSKRSVVDFNDLEHFCLQILSQRDEEGRIIPSPVALSYRERFAEILVDEYQDSNLVQEIIINMISGKQQKDDAAVPVFMVGDVKQSIYRFRQARPELFLDKYNTYSPNKGEEFRKILLFKNFRSRKCVVDAVNFIFGQIMSVRAGELDYTEKEALNPGAVFSDVPGEDAHISEDAELHLIHTGSMEGGNNEDENPGADEDGDQEEEEVLDNIQCESRLVARRIQELMKPDQEGREFYIFDKGKKEYRRLEYRDIVILLRTTRNWSDVFAEELTQAGIPVFADTGSGFFKTVEVQVVLSLLQVIDNPLQDIPLLSVLRSPIVAFTTDELADLRLADRKAPLFEALTRLAQTGMGEGSVKAGAFLKNLERWRDMSLYLPTDQLIWKLYDETGYYGMVGAMPAGEQRQANLRILFERARQFEETSYKGLFNFISFIDKLKSSRGDMGSAKILSENDNVVRIMSIHKSKGLEFPVVFVSGCGKKFNLQDMNKSILLHQDLGFGPDVVDHRLRVSWPSAAKQAIREKIRKETLSEEMRILYVALTRAREKLIITGAVNDAGKAVARWMASASSAESRIPGHIILKGNNYLDWIGPALMRHKECGVLRELAPVGTDYCGGSMEDDSRWKIRIWSRNDVLGSKQEEEGDDARFIQWLDSLKHQEYASGYKEEIDRRLNWEYAFSRVSAVPAKVSVTELKRRFNYQSDEDGAPISGYTPVLVKKPMFLEGKKGLSSAEKGTVLHFIMQHLKLQDIKAVLGDESSIQPALTHEISSQIEWMAARDLLTLQQADSVDVNKISRFFSSDLGRRMLASESISREVPFHMEIPCSELYRNMDNAEFKGETVLLQGVIDCFFEEPDGIVLVDYKTDYVAPGKEDEIRQKYELQINCYARALERIAGKKVKARYIYLFWNDSILAY